MTVLTGFAGLLNLGAAAFVAVGAYSYAILTWPGYPFQLGFWLGLLAAVAAGALAGVALAIPTLRLRGDYVAIVTLGAGVDAAQLGKALVIRYAVEDQAIDIGEIQPRIF